jgi:hypothetical protein
MYPEKGNIMNLVNHGWVFKEFVEGRITNDIPSCIFPEVGVDPMDNRGVSFNHLRMEFMSQHFNTKGRNAGTLALSPNNHRFFVT